MRWIEKDKPNPTQVAQLQQDLGIDTILASLLVQRGITTFDQAKSFFRPDIKALHDPFLMKDMHKALDRIRQAFFKKESILVYGDYDVDGTTSVALLSTYLNTKYDRVFTYIPDRYQEGYGVSYKGIDFAFDNDISLIIALDCGIKAVDKVAYATEKGIDFIICDHHRPGTVLPDAVAILNPKQQDCAYPYKELCGCGVGFKLIQALAVYYKEPFTNLFPYLDLVATAIAADIVPITGENRILAYYGMQVINTNPRSGIKALLAQKKQKPTGFTITDVVFTVAPRINAAGRIEHASHAVTLLTEQDPIKAQQYAKEIEVFNTDRRGLDQQTTQEALLQIENNKEKDAYTTVVYDPSWHKGVIGIVASRLTETYYRPTLVFTQSGDKLAASARSVIGFDVYQAIEACSAHLEQFGGHKYAAGLTMRKEQYPAFKAAFEAQVAKTITKALQEPELEIDAVISLEQITPKFNRILKQLAPFGPGNMQPRFKTDKVYADTTYFLGQQKEHLKLTLRQNQSIPSVAAIGFSMADKYKKEIPYQDMFSVVYTVEENHWNNQTTIQLHLKDVKKGE